MSNKQKVDKHFVSQIDKDLAEFDRNYSKSAVQKAEIKKYQRIYQLRDNAIEKVNGEEPEL